jgi:hypothetical protein
MDQQPDLFDSFVRIQCCVPLVSSRDSSFRIFSAPVPTGLLSLLALSVVDASRCGLLWDGVDINIPLHGRPALSRPILDRG